MFLYSPDASQPKSIYIFPADTLSGGTPSGSDVRRINVPQGLTEPVSIALFGNQIVISDEVGRELFFVAENTAHNTTPIPTKKINLPTTVISTPNGLAINADGIYVADDNGDEIVLVPDTNASEITDANGTIIVTLAESDVIKRFDLPSDVSAIEGLSIIGDQLVVVDRTDRQLYFVPKSTANGATAVLTRKVRLPSDITEPRGIAMDPAGAAYIAEPLDDKIYLVPTTKPNETIDASGTVVVVLQSSDIIRQFNMPSGLTGSQGLALGSPQATPTITSTHIFYEGQSGDIAIDFDADVTGFLLSDVTVTGATANSLTANSATSYTLNVTAIAGAGTIRVSIAEDVVSPSNATASETFTRLALPTISIAFDDTEGESGGTTGVSINSTAAITGLALSDFNVTNGALSNLQGSGTSYTATLTFPSTGSDTTTVRLPVNSVEPGNAEVEASIGYVEPLILSLTVPSQPVGNTFSIILNSNYELAGVALSDFRLRRTDGTAYNLGTHADVDATLIAVSGTNNWQLDITLTGTFDHDFSIRLRRRQLIHDGVNVPETFFDSETFHVDSSLDAPAAPTVSITVTPVSLRHGRIATATIEWSEVVDDFDDADVSVNVGSLGSLSGSGTTYTVPVTAPDDGTTGNIVLTIRANAVGQTNAETTYQIPYSALPTVRITFDPPSVRGSRVTSATLAFSENVTGLDIADVSVNVGTLGPLSGSGDTYTVDITAPATGSGNIELTLREDAVNEFNAETSQSVAYSPLPTATITFDPPSVRGSRVTSATLAFSENVTGLDIADVSVNVGTLGPLSGSGDTYTVDITAPATGSGNIELTLREDAVNEFNAETKGTVAYSSLPTAVITFNKPKVIVGQEVEATLEFSESVTGLGVGDLSVNVGSVDTLTGSGTTWVATLTVPSSGSGNITLTVSADAVDQGNAETAASVAYAPFTAEFSNLPTGTVNNVFSMQFDVSHPVTGLSVDNLRLRRVSGNDSNDQFYFPSTSELTITAIAGTDNYLLEFNLSGTFDGVYAVRLRKETLTSGSADYPSRALNSANITIDSDYGQTTPVVPTATIAFDPASLRGGRITTATLAFSESVTGLDAADLSVNVGTLGTLSGSGDTYTVEITAPVTGSGNIELTIAAGAIDQAGFIETTGTVAYSPLPTAAISFDPPTVRGGRVTTATLTFSESVTGLDIADVSVNVGTLGPLSGSGDTYTVDITAPSTGSGNIELTLREDAVNEFNAETSGSVAYAPLPTATIAFDPPSVRGSRVTSATLAFSENVTGFTRADLSVNVGTLGPLSGSGDTYSVAITAPSTGSGNIELTLREDAVNEFNAETSQSVAYSPLPTATIAFDPPSLQGGQTTTATLAFSESVTGFDAADLSVNVGVLANFSGAGNTYTVEITAPSTGSGNIVLTLREDAVNEGNAESTARIAYEPLPVVMPDALSVTIESGYPVRYVQEIGVDAPANANDYPVRFEWNRAAEGFDTDDITVTGATLQSLKKLGPTFYEAMVRPPESGNSTISVSVRAGAVREGNNKTDATFAYTDTVATETLFDWNSVIPNIFADDSSGRQYGPAVGILVEASRVRLLGNAQSMTKIFALLHDGTRLAAEDIAATANITAQNLDVNLSRVNNMWFTNVHNQDTGRDFFNSYWSYVGSRVWTDFDADDFGILETDFGEVQSGLTGLSYANAAHSADINRWGLFFPSRYSGRVFAQNFAGMQQNLTGITTDPFLGIPLVAVGDRVYRGGSVYRALSNSGAITIPGETLNISTLLETDFSVYGKWLYHTGSQTDTNLYRTDLEKYRAPAVRSRILPQFVVEGESLDLTLFASGAETILFESAYAAPAYLSIDSNLNLDVADGEILEDTCILVKLRAFSLRGDTPLEFYLVIEKKKRPEWKPIATLPIDNGETVNLFDLVKNARRIAWQSGFQVPSGWTLTAGQLTVSNQTSETPVEIALTAFNNVGSRDHTFNVLPRVSGVITTSDIYDYRVLIEGLDVTDDLLEIPSVHQSLDVINPNEFVSDDASFTLSSDRGKYDGRVAGNFWEVERSEHKRVSLGNRTMG